MKRLFAAAALCASLLAGPAFAGTVENSFGNTLTLTFADGGVARYHFEPGGAYSMVAPDGAAVSGAWAVENNQICLTPTGGDKACTPYEAAKNVGDSWTAAMPNGGSVTVAIVAGR